MSPLVHRSEPAPADRFAEQEAGAVLQWIRERAAAADRGETTLAPDLAALHDAGVLAAVVAHTGVDGDTAAGVRLLRRIGRASLSVGRIVEGHANALRLIQLYGTSRQRSTFAGLAADGGIFGVWGADGREPVTFAASRDGCGVLTGAKMFCSGLGILSIAVVPVKTDAGPLLLLAPVDDPDRADVSVWDVSGMRATASGRYELTGVLAEVLGRPGDFHREPHFEGGIWRYCALHCGGLEALAEGVRQHLLARGQAGQPEQAERMARLVLLAHSARMWVEAAGSAVERAAVTEGARPRAALTQVLLARQAVETACLDGIALAERAMGTMAFAGPCEVDRIRRDLGFFLRQANLDGKLRQASGALMADAKPVGEMW